MPKIGRTLSYINTERKGKSTEQSSVPQSLGSSRPGGSVSIPQGDYLLKSIWDKVFEIRTDSQGTEYILGKLPVVTQYGITMYSGDGVDIPSLASGLPFDGRTIWYNPDTQQIEVIGGTGGGSGEGVSNFWDLNNIPSWITNSKPKYSYSEIEGTPDLSVYALDTELSSLSAIVSEKADKSELSKYIPIQGYTDILGEKNFTGGLKVNGSPIYYDTEKKYWKLEGDLLVTGGVTMYGSDSSFTPSTIMDAILYDSATLGINSNGQLYVIGGTGGEGLDITALQNYLTSNSYLNVTSGDNRYLQLSGGTLASSGNPLAIKRTDNNGPGLVFYSKDTQLGSIGISTDYVPKFYNANAGLLYTIWHSGNFNPSNYLPLSGGSTITGNVIIKAALYGENYISWKNPETTEGGYFYGTSFNASKNYTWTNSLLNWNVDTGVINFIKTPTVNGDSVWHSGNDGHNSGLDADTLDGYHVTHFMSYVKGSGYVQANLLNSELWNIAGGDGYIEYYDNGTWFNSRWGKVMAHYGFEGSLSGNASSATKLQNSRSIWGRAFDGTSDITGSLYITNNKAIYIEDASGNWLNQIEVSSSNSFNLGYSSGGRGYSTFLYGGDITLKAGTSRVTSLYIDSNCNAVYNGMFTIKRAAQVPLYVHNSSGSDVCLRFVSQDVYRASLGTNSGDYLLRYNSDLSASYKIWDAGNDGHNSGLDADTLDGYHSSSFMNFTATESYVGASMGNETLSKRAAGNGYIEFWDGAGGWFNFRCGYIKSSSSMYIASSLFLGDGGEGIYLHGSGINFHNSSNTWIASCVNFDRNGNMTALHNLLVNGGITMYSDQRKKTILNHVELSLKDIANAPLIEHYYNGDDKKTTHVGSIAQYWASMNDWFCKLDNEGYYTMEIQNAALASAISIARELDRYETKTDKAIKKLKKRISELEDEVERFKSA